MIGLKSQVRRLCPVRKNEDWDLCEEQSGHFSVKWVLCAGVLSSPWFARTLQSLSPEPVSLLSPELGDTKGEGCKTAKMATHHFHWELCSRELQSLYLLCSPGRR